MGSSARRAFTQMETSPFQGGVKALKGKE